jgi:hypothetical protein
MISKDQFHGLHRELMASPGVEGGFSIHAMTGAIPSEGSMVSYEGESKTTPASATRPSHLARYVRENRKMLSRPDVYFGGWKPESDAFTTLDRSQQILPSPAVAAEYGEDVAEADSLTTALDLGVSRNQFSVHNFRRGRSISTGARE